MTGIKLTKVKQDELTLMQEVLLAWSADQPKLGLYDYLSTRDICLKVWKALRTKVEAGRKFSAITLRYSEAVMISRALGWMTKHGTWEKTVAYKYHAVIDQQIKSVNLNEI